MSYEYLTNYLNYSTPGGSLNTTTAFYPYNASEGPNVFGIGNVPDGNVTIPDDNGLTIEGHDLYQAALTNGGLPQTVWDPNAGRVAPSQIMVIANVNGGALFQGTAALLLTQIAAINNYLNAEYLKTGWVLLPGGGVIEINAANIDAPYGLTGFLQRSTIPLPGGAPTPLPEPPPPVQAPPTMYMTVDQANAVYLAILNRPLPADADASATTDANFVNEVAYSQEAATDIDNTYLNILGRPISGGDQATIQGQLAQGQLTLQQFMNNIATSSEAQGDVNTIFLQALNRPVGGDPSWFEAQLASGQLTMAGVRSFVANSVEAASDLADYWSNVLGTSIDPNWQAAQIAYLASGGTLATIWANLAGSPSATAAISTIWTNILGSSVDPNWQAAQQGFLSTGGTLSAITAGLAGTPEAAAAVATIWSNILGTTVDPNWQAAQQGFLATGGRLGEITSGLANSPEAAAAVSTVWTNILSTAVDPNWQAAQQSFLAGGGTLGQVGSGLANSSEAAGDINDTWQGIVGSADISPGLLEQIQANLPSSGISGAVSLILSDPTAQQDIVNDSNSILQTPLTASQVQDEVSALNSSASGTIGLTWLNIAANLTSSLLNFLNPIASAQAETLPTKPIDTSAPLPTLEPDQVPAFPIPSGDKVAFVGGLFDQSISGIVQQTANLYNINHPNSSSYFNFGQENDLLSYINSNQGHVVVIGHSYGGDTAATAVAQSSFKVDALLTLDPVSLFTPSYQQVANNTNTWLDYNAVGGGITDRNNVIAGLGGDWGQPVARFATQFYNVDLDHAAIGGQPFITHLIGP